MLTQRYTITHAIGKYHPYLAIVALLFGCCCIGSSGCVLQQRQYISQFSTRERCPAIWSTNEKQTLKTKRTQSHQIWRWHLATGGGTACLRLWGCSYGAGRGGIYRVYRDGDRITMYWWWKTSHSTHFVVMNLWVLKMQRVGVQNRLSTNLTNKT